MHQSYQPASHHSPQMTTHPHVQPPQMQTPHACPGSGTPPRIDGMQEQPQQLYHPENTYYYQYGAAEYGYPPAGTVLPDASANVIGSWFEFSGAGYLKGFLIGAGVTLLLTNTALQKSLIRGTVKLCSLAQGGVEEVKEQFMDIKAEMSQEK